MPTMAIRSESCTLRALAERRPPAPARLRPELVLLDPLRRSLGQRSAELPEPRHLEAGPARGGEGAELLLGQRTPRHHERLDLLPEHRIRHADDRHLGDERMLGERLLDQQRRDVLAAAADDVLLPVDEVEPAVLVNVAEVAGEEPLAAERS